MGCVRTVRLAASKSTSPIPQSSVSGSFSWACVTSLYLGQHGFSKSCALRRSLIGSRATLGHFGSPRAVRFKGSRGHSSNWTVRFATDSRSAAVTQVLSSRQRTRAFERTPTRQAKPQHVPLDKVQGLVCIVKDLSKVHNLHIMNSHEMHNLHTVQGKTAPCLGVAGRLKWVVPVCHLAPSDPCVANISRASSVCHIILKLLPLGPAKKGVCSERLPGPKPTKTARSRTS